MVKYDSHDDLPKTAKFRGKVFGGRLIHNTMAEAKAYIKKQQTYINKHKKEKVANFFTVIKKFEVKDKPVFVVYWRAVYLKAPLKKRLAEMRAGKYPLGWSGHKGRKYPSQEKK